ncbi:MAG TPA: flagellin [Magnetospirillum sp.]|nr:flagellin [Magnetospirillum sp.]
MADTVTLSSSIRNNLLSLQNTSSLVNRTNTRLSTGQKISSAIDDAVGYFQAKGLSDRAGDLTERKSAIDQGISNLKTAMGAIESVEKVLNQMKGLVLSAKSATATERDSLATQFNTLASQLNQLANDATYQGLNMVNTTAAKLSVQFSDKTAATLDVNGIDIRTSALASLSDAAASVAASFVAGEMWACVSVLVSSFDTAIQKLDSAITGIRTNAKTLGANVALLQTRLDFTKSYVNTLTEGSNKLTLADLNEEGANLVSLQTRQQLGIQALSFAGQQEQGVLSLFR